MISKTWPSNIVSLWDFERVSTSLIQTLNGIRCVDLPYLPFCWSLLHIPLRYISFPINHSEVWVSWLIFDVGGWRRWSSVLTHTRIFESLEINFRNLSFWNGKNEFSTWTSIFEITLVSISIGTFNLHISIFLQFL